MSMKPRSSESRAAEKADLLAIDEARLGAHQTAFAQVVCVSMYFLRSLADELGKPMSAVTMEDVLAEMKKPQPTFDDLLQRNRTKNEGAR
jgi:hypothetical protein